MDENTYFEHDDVKVTNMRFITGRQTFAIKNVTSIKTSVEKPNRLIPIMIGIFGSMMSLALPLLLILVAALTTFVWRKQKTTYQIGLCTAGGESNALQTHQPDYFKKVVDALNKAIVDRS